MNVGPVRVTATVNATQFTITSTLANATYTAGGIITICDPLDLAYNGASFLFDTATATQAINPSRTAGNTKFENAAYTVGTTAPSNTPTLRTESFLPTTRYTLQVFPDYNIYTSLAVDSVTTNLAGPVRTNQIPDSSKFYKPRVRVKNLPNASITVGTRITAAAKTGTTTATITTETAHGLTTSDFIQIQGIRDIAVNFPNLIAATAVASVIDANNFTVIL